MTPIKQLRIYILLGFMCLGVMHSSTHNSGIVKGVKKLPIDIKRLYVLSIAIDRYKKPYYPTQNAVSDSRTFIDSLQANYGSSRYYNSAGVNKKLDDVIIDTLYNEHATRDSIIDRLKKIINVAGENDAFIFQYAGMSQEVLFDDLQERFQTVLIPYIDQEMGYKEFTEKTLRGETDVLALKEIAALLNSLQCQKQLIISEAGDGAQFKHNLMANLFETDPLLNIGSNRQRIILTSASLGYDQTTLEDTVIQQGPLSYFICQRSHVLDVFIDYNAYEYDLQHWDLHYGPYSKYTKSDSNRTVKTLRYSAMLNEKDYREFSLRTSSVLNNIQSRGVIVSSEKENKNSNAESSETYAVIIGNNKYNRQSGWSNLKNPINDAKDVANILSSKYGVKTIELYDKPKDSVLFTIANLRSVLDSSDKLIVFIAGHGYFSSFLSDGNIVFGDSKSIDEDPLLNSYLQMATLNRVLNTLPCRSLFTIFDVCFGATFDLLSQDLELSTYQEAMDISLESFTERKSSYSSRIFLSSGRYEVPDYWNNSLNHSPFASKLLNQLEKETDFICPGRILNALQGNATEPFLKKFGSHDDKADFILPVQHASD